MKLFLTLLCSILFLYSYGQQADTQTEIFRCTHKMDDNALWQPVNVTISIDNTKQQITVQEVESIFLTLLYTNKQELNGSVYYKYTLLNGERVNAVIGGLADRHIVSILRDNYVCPTKVMN